MAERPNSTVGRFLASRFSAAASGRRKVWARFLGLCKREMVNMVPSTGFRSRGKSLKYRESRGSGVRPAKIILAQQPRRMIRGCGRDASVVRGGVQIYTEANPGRLIAWSG